MTSTQILSVLRLALFDPALHSESQRLTHFPGHAMIPKIRAGEVDVNPDWIDARLTVEIIDEKFTVVDVK